MRVSLFATVCLSCFIDFFSIRDTPAQEVSAPVVLHDFELSYDVRGIFSSLDQDSFSSPPLSVEDAGGRPFAASGVVGDLRYEKSGENLSTTSSATVDWSGTLIIHDLYITTSHDVWVRGIPGDTYGTVSRHSLTWSGFQEDGTIVELSAFDESQFYRTVEGDSESTSFDLAIVKEMNGTIHRGMVSREYFGLTYYQVPFLSDAGAVIRDNSEIHARVGETCTIFCGGPSVLRGTLTQDSEYLATVDHQSCAELVEGAVKPTIIDNRIMSAVFGPNGGVTLDEAAERCGVDHFNWVQWVVEDTSPHRPTVRGVQPPIPYVDPPLGGWDYEQPIGADQLPGYLDEGTQFAGTNWHVDNWTSDFRLIFADEPGTGIGNVIRFRTALAGVDDANNFGILGEVFEWESTSVGVEVRRNDDSTLVESPSLKLLSVFPVSDLDSSDIEFLGANGVAIVPEPSYCSLLIILGMLVLLGTRQLSAAT